MTSGGKVHCNRGVYVLWLFLPRQAAISIGKLGTFVFQAGVYAYCGSAQRNLQQRIRRHRRLQKKLHWHIDYFRAEARCLGEAVFLGHPKEKECRLVQELLRIPGTAYAAAGFGSSDCRCPSHLLYVPWASPKSRP